MTDETTSYIAIPRTTHRPERIDNVLAKRMKEFMLMRRQKIWQEEGY